MRFSNRAKYRALVGVIAITISATSQAEIVTLTLTSDSFIANDGACYDPLGIFGSLIRGNPEAEQAYLDATGFEELPPLCLDPGSGTVGLSGTIDIELTPAGPGTNASVAFLNADIVADGIVRNTFNSFAGDVFNEIDGARLNIRTPTGPPPPSTEINDDGTFSLTPHEFSFDGGISSVSGTGALGFLIDQSPTTVPFDLATNPIELSQAISRTTGLDPLNLTAIIDGSGSVQGSYEFRLFIPFTLGFFVEEVAEDLVKIFPVVLGDFSTSFDGVIIATGSSSFPVPPSSLLVVPEPSTLLLAVVAVPLLGVAGYRSRKRLRCKQV